LIRTHLKNLRCKTSEDSEFNTDRREDLTYSVFKIEP